MKTIRETEFDRTGGFKAAHIYRLGTPNESIFAKLFVDRIGRVIVPTDEHWETATHIEFQGGKKRAVVKKETRYEGQEEVALVMYLEAKEEGDAEIN